MAEWIFHPPLARPSGGTMVLTQLARRLLELDRLGGVLFWDATHPDLDLELPWVPAKEAGMAHGDTLIVPEGWPNALAFGFRAGCRTRVYCQNWSYLFQGLEAGVRWRDLPVDFVAVSDPVAWHLEQVLGRRPPVVRPAVDTNVFRVPARKPGGPPRIGFMPRKNRALAEQVRRIFEERNPGAGVEWVPIEGLDPAGVARTLASCHVFLATGFPEGLGLPPLEAMACGCLCAGFTGFGGWDYMRQVEGGAYLPHGYAPREVPWEGNGWWSADGDVLGAAMGLEGALDVLLSADGRLGHVLDQGLRTARAYAAGNQRLEIEAAFGGRDAAVAPSPT